MKRRPRQMSQISRLGIFEKLEPRNLMATLLSDNFDPIDPTHFSARWGSSIFGSAHPESFHEGNALYFDGDFNRYVTTVPVSMIRATIEFRLRLPDGSAFFQTTEQSHKDIIVEGSKDGGTTYIPIRTIRLNDVAFMSHDVWNRVTINMPASLESSATILRIRQENLHVACCGRFGIDELQITGTPYPLRMEPIARTLRNTPVESVEFGFDVPINTSSLSTAALTLTQNNVVVPFDFTVTLQALPGNRYALNGLTKFTNSGGNYRLSLSGAALLDPLGQVLGGMESITWVNDQTAPVLVDVMNVSPDPRTGNGKGVSFVDVAFSEQIDLSTFDYRDVSLYRDGESTDLIDSSVVILGTVRPWVYRIAHLQELTDQGGRYELRVDGVFRDLAGNVGSGRQNDSWLANDPPEVVLGGTLIFPEDSRPLAIAGRALVSDIDTPVLRNGSLVVSILDPKPTEQIAIFDRPDAITRIGILGNQIHYDLVRIGTFAGGVGADPLKITLNTRATLEAVQALLRNINYAYAGEVPTQMQRTVQVVVEDGEGGESVPRVLQVILYPVNDSPDLVIPAIGPIAYERNLGPVVMVPTLSLQDRDNLTFYNGTLVVEVVAGRDRSEVLALSGAFSMVQDSVRYHGAEIGRLNSDGKAGHPLAIRFNELATQAVVQDLFRSVTFSTLQNRVLGRRMINMYLRDGRGGVSNTGLVEVNVL